MMSRKMILLVSLFAAGLVVAYLLVQILVPYNDLPHLPGGKTETFTIPTTTGTVVSR